MTLEILLAAVGFTEATDFNELCAALRLSGHLPEERSQWHSLFTTVKDAERRALLTCRRVQSYSGTRIESLQLTEAGANLIREKLDEKRGLLAALEK